jgi:predicted MFS family arabinose efflux permease
MVGAGWISDRYSRTWLLSVIYGVRALAYVLLRFGAQSKGELLVFAVIFGFVDYSVIPPTVSLIETHFGEGVVGLGVGILLLWHSLGASAGAWVGGVSYDARGDYGHVLLVAVVLCALASVAVLTIPEPRRREHRHGVKSVVTPEEHEGLGKPCVEEQEEATELLPVDVGHSSIAEGEVGLEIPEPT